MAKATLDQQPVIGYAYATREEQFIDELIEKWQFYRPSAPLAGDILLLRKRLGDHYLDNEYEHSRAKGSDADREEDSEDVRALESELTRNNGFESLLKQVAGILGLSQPEHTLSADSSNESVAHHQSFISERIYNHMAMLGRTPRTLRGEAFSIRKEMTEGIAEKIGLGLYLSPRINKELQQETETVLLDMAGAYQDWLLFKTRQGPLETTWGYICVSNQKLSEEQRNAYPLILNPDVVKTQVATKM